MTSIVKTLAFLALGASALILTGASGTAYADQHGGWRSGGGHHGKMGRGFMRRYDANKDRKVTQEEIDSNRTSRHGKYDANGDGKLSLKEFQDLWLEAYRRKMVRDFQHFDVDGDAAVTLEEYTEPMSRVVERRDRNGDGVLSRDDRKRKHHRKHHMRHGRDEGDGGSETQEKTKQPAE